MIDSQKTGNFIKEARISKGLSQNDLADMLNISRVAVSKWENGHNMPDISTMELLADILDVDVNEIIKGEHLETEPVVPQKHKYYIPVIILLVLVTILAMFNAVSYVKWNDNSMELQYEYVYSLEDGQRKGLLAYFVYLSDDIKIDDLQSKEIIVNGDDGNSYFVTIVSCSHKWLEFLSGNSKLPQQTIISYHKYEETDLTYDFYILAYYPGRLNKFNDNMTISDFLNLLKNKEGSYYVLY